MRVDKLVRSGGGWLAGHPDKTLIIRRYLGRHRGLTRAALARLAEVGDETEGAIEPAEEEEILQSADNRVPLNAQRQETVCQAYLRIIYGPDYAQSLDILRDRHLGKKRQLARREHGLGLEALTGFVEHAPLWRVHQSVFAVLALESEPVDPRL